MLTDWELRTIARETKRGTASPAQHADHARWEMRRQVLKMLEVTGEKARQVKAAEERTLRFNSVLRAVLQQALPEGHPVPKAARSVIGERNKRLLRDIDALHQEAQVRLPLPLYRRVARFHDSLAKKAKDIYAKPASPEHRREELASVLYRNLPQAMTLNEQYLQHVLGREDYAAYARTVRKLDDRLLKHVARHW